MRGDIGAEVVAEEPVLPDPQGVPLTLEPQTLVQPDHAVPVLFEPGREMPRLAPALAVPEIGKEHVGSEKLKLRIWAVFDKFQTGGDGSL